VTGTKQEAQSGTLQLEKERGMAKVTGKLVTRTLMEDLRAELKKRAAEPPPKIEKYTRTQLALELENEIQEMLKAGYALTQIAGIFKEKGVEIGVATLKTRKRVQAGSKNPSGIEGAKERITATETASKGATPSGRFAVRPDSTDL
jgi:hypothetical protein